MQTSTLRGVFPEPKVAYRRNFIKENVKSIKQMQGLLQEAGVIQPKPQRDDKFRTQPKIQSRDSTPNRHVESQEKYQSRRVLKKNMASVSHASRLKLDKKKDKTNPEVEHEKFTHRSMQTERTDDLNKLYETGVIKYPSINILKVKMTSREVSPLKNEVVQGDTNLENEIQNLEIDEKDFIKENMNMKTRVLKQQSSKVLAQAPASYQRGVVPKYLRDRKDDSLVEAEEPCPEGHILLPEEERKETLRVLRQSYADRIQELNSLPVRSDTLRIKKRKMEIEEELKRIDGGIKVFQRPKVFVKINA